MTTLLSYCGIHCDTCPIHIATIEENSLTKLQLRTAIANTLRQRYGMNFSPEEVTDCDGCTLETGRLFKPCAECVVRHCARERQHDSCAYCSDYICDKLQTVFNEQPEAHSTIERLRL